MENKELAILESVLVVSEKAPKDLLTDQGYADAIDKAIETVKPLVFPATDDGGKASKKTTASIRKYAKAVKAQVDSEFKDKTSSLTTAKTLLIGKTKELNDIAKSIDEQQAERITKQLAEIRELLILELAYAWNDSGVRNEYQTDLACIEKAVILTSLTPKGVLTKKAKDYVHAVCDKNYQRQSLIDSRFVILENKCMKAGVDASALTREYIGDAFISDDDTFNSRVDELLAIEVSKKEAAAKQIEIDKQKAVDDALKAQQEEANRIAQEKANQASLECAEARKVETVKEMEKLPSEITQQVRQQMDKDRAEAEEHQRATVTPIRTEQSAQKPVNGKHPVQITFTLEKMIPDSVSDTAVEKHFINNVLPKELFNLLVSHSVKTVKKAG